MGTFIMFQPYFLLHMYRKLGPGSEKVPSMQSISENTQVRERFDCFEHYR